MGLAFEVVTGGKTAITGGAFEALTPASGNTFSIRNFEGPQGAQIEEVWIVNNASKGRLSIKSPRMHDQTRGLLVANAAPQAAALNEEPSLALPGFATIPLYASDVLAVEYIGSASDDVVASFLVAYNDLQGADGRFVTWEAILSRIRSFVGILVTPTAGTITYGTAVALDSSDNRLKANTDYALLGADVDLACCTVGITGPDTSNYRVGMPGKVVPQGGGDWFVNLSRKYNKPHIPVINSNNKGNTLIDVVQADDAAAVNVTLILAELAR